MTVLSVYLKKWEDLPKQEIQSLEKSWSFSLQE